MTRAAYNREWRRRNPEKTKQYCAAWKRRNPDAMVKITKDAYERLVGTKEGMARRMIYKARERGRESVAISAVDVLTVWPVDDKCPVFAVPFFYGRRPSREPHHRAPSLDRIRSTEGYVKGNIAVVSWRANKIKTDATATELELVAAWLRRMT